MVSAIPGSSTSFPPASKASTGWHFAPVPDLNRETKRQITKAAAWPTFIGICLALRQEGRKGRTPAIRQAAKDQQRVSVGLRHLARDMGLNVSTVRRQVSRLAELGLIVVHRPNVESRVDHATGRIVTKAKGRCENTRIYLSIQPLHLRPAKAGMGAKCAHPAADSSPCKVQSAPTVIDSKNQRVPDGLATGVGQPQAAQAGRLPAADAPGLTAGEAGGHTAAKAGQEGRPIVPEDAGRDEPVLPLGRMLGTPRTHTRRQTAGRQEPPARSAAEASAQWHRRDPEQERRRAEYLAAKAAKAAGRYPEPERGRPSTEQGQNVPVSAESLAESGGAAVEPFDAKATETARQAALAMLEKAVTA